VIGIAQTERVNGGLYAAALAQGKVSAGHRPRALILVPPKSSLYKYWLRPSSLRNTPTSGCRHLWRRGSADSDRHDQKGVDIRATPGRRMEIYLRNELPVKQIKPLCSTEADRMMVMGFMPQSEDYSK